MKPKSYTIFVPGLYLHSHYTAPEKLSLIFAAYKQFGAPKSRRSDNRNPGSQLVLEWPDFRAMGWPTGSRWTATTKAGELWLMANTPANALIR